MLNVRTSSVLSICGMLLLGGCFTPNKTTPPAAPHEPNSSSIVESSPGQSDDAVSQTTPETDDSADPQVSDATRLEVDRSTSPDADDSTSPEVDHSTEGEHDHSTGAEEDDSNQANSVLTPTDDTSDTERPRDNNALFQDLRDNHWSRIFPRGRRNVGGPQFFKYIYEELATDHDLFVRYSKFYCGVSGSIVRPHPEDLGRYDVVKIKDSNGQCVMGKYYRCCWPCVCDIMKHARAEQVTVRLPKDETQTEKRYWVLTIGDPCHRCDQSPCADLPPEVTTYQCQEGVTANGLRVHNGQLTSGYEGRLVFALLHEAAPANESSLSVSSDVLSRCAPRINATPVELERMGGMGNIFVDVALVNSEEPLTNSFEDLCE